MHHIILVLMFLALSTVSGIDTNLYYKTTSDGRTCIKCAPGTYFIKDCSVGDVNSTVCQPCPDERFSPIWNVKRLCKECTPQCQGKDEIVALPCNTTHDLRCGCEAGYFHEMAHDPSASKCIAYKQCGKGMGVDKPIPRYHDVTCVPCVKGMNFSDVSAYDSSCQSCRNCQAEGWNVTAECTPLQNTVCDIKTTTTAEPPSTRSSQSTTKPVPSATTTKGPTIDVLLVASLLTLFALLVIIAVLVAIYFYYKLRKNINIFDRSSWTRSANFPAVPVHAGGSTGESLARIQHPVEGEGSVTYQHNNGVDSVCTTRTPLSQRRPSLVVYLELKPEVDGQVVNLHDINMSVQLSLGSIYDKFIKNLQGSEKLMATDWAAARARGSTSDIIIELLQMWEERNEDLSKNDVLTEFYLSFRELRMIQEAENLRKKYATDSGDSVLQDGGNANGGQNL